MLLVAVLAAEHLYAIKYENGGTTFKRGCGSMDLAGFGSGPMNFAKLSY
jgi:hypothetical protein